MPAGLSSPVYLKDLLAYKRKRDEKARKALGRLVAEAQDLGIYDEWWPADIVVPADTTELKSKYGAEFERRRRLMDEASKLSRRQ